MGLVSRPRRMDLTPHAFLFLHLFTAFWRKVSCRCFRLWTEQIADDVHTEQLSVAICRYDNTLVHKILEEE